MEERRSLSGTGGDGSSGPPTAGFRWKLEKKSSCLILLMQHPVKGLLTRVPRYTFQMGFLCRKSTFLYTPLSLQDTGLLQIENPTLLFLCFVGLSTLEYMQMLMGSRKSIAEQMKSRAKQNLLTRDKQPNRQGS
ncbi:unnamed protein product [Urochloa humidicola]